MRHVRRNDIVFSMLVAIALLIGLYRVGVGTPLIVRWGPSASTINTADIHALYESKRHGRDMVSVASDTRATA